MLWVAKPTLARNMTSSIVKSSINFALSASGTQSALLLDCERYSSIPQLLPCGPDPGRGLSEDSKKMKSFLDDDDDEGDENSDGRSAASQLESYMKEVPIKSRECPGAWWRLNQTKYPDIARLARKYLTVQGTSTPAERVMSDMGNILNKKRLAMTDRNFRMLMYLTDAN